MRVGDDAVAEPRDPLDAAARGKRARRGHHRPSAGRRRARREDTLSRAEAAGIDLAALTAELEREGVRSFWDAYRDLLTCIETKR